MSNVWNCSVVLHARSINFGEPTAAGPLSPLPALRINVHAPAPSHHTRLLPGDVTMGGEHSLSASSALLPPREPSKSTALRPSPRRESENSPSEHLGLGPISCDENPVPQREELGEVGRPPEVVGRETSNGQVTTHHRQISDSLVRSNVRQRALVRVVEGADVGGADHGVGERVEACWVGIGRLGLLELLEQSVLLRELSEDAREVSSLLRSSLGAANESGQ